MKRIAIGAKLIAWRRLVTASFVIAVAMQGVIYFIALARKPPLHWTAHGQSFVLFMKQYGHIQDWHRTITLTPDNRYFRQDWNISCTFVDMPDEQRINEIAINKIATHMSKNPDIINRNASPIYVQPDELSLWGYRRYIWTHQDIEYRAIGYPYRHSYLIRINLQSDRGAWIKGNGRLIEPQLGIYLINIGTIAGDAALLDPVMLVANIIVIACVVISIVAGWTIGLGVRNHYLHRCIKCGYSIEDQLRCPECGTLIR